MKKKRKFSAGRDYSAKYTFVTRTGPDGEVLSTSTITTTFSGTLIVKHGLKSRIYHHAKRLGIPRGYSCDVEEND